MSLSLYSLQKGELFVFILHHKFSGSSQFIIYEPQSQVCSQAGAMCYTDSL